MSKHSNSLFIESVTLSYFLQQSNISQHHKISEEQDFYLFITSVDYYSRWSTSHLPSSQQN